MTNLPKGTRYARWTVVAPAERVRGVKANLCVCDCGTQRVVPEYRMTTGRSRSCGCRRADVQRTLKTRHGLSDSAVYWVWHSMRQRCVNPKDRAYKNYGGRGITVCPQWSDFATFFADMGAPPPGHTLERKDNSGNYEPSNCRWASRAEQMANTRATRRIEIGGRLYTIKELAAAEGVTPHAVYCRIFQYGWPVERAAPITSKGANDHIRPA